MRRSFANRNSRRFAAAFIAIVAVASSRAAAQGDEQVIDGGVNGKCVAKPYLAATNIRAQFEKAEVFRCGEVGGLTAPAAFLYRVPVSGDPAGVETAYLTSSSWRGKLDTIAECEQPSYAPVIGDQAAGVLKCRLNSGGFPYVAFAIALKGKLYVAEGPPGMVVTLARKIARDADMALDDKAFAGAGAWAADASSGNDISARDIAAYTILLQQALLANREFDFSASARHYQEALDLHERHFGRKDSEQFNWAPGRADLLSHFALEMSNLGRFQDANLLFDRAKSLYGVAPQPRQSADLRTYLAIHAANQGERETALRFAQEASTIRREISKPYLDKALARDRRNPDDVAVIERDPNFLDASARIALANIAASENVTGLLLQRLESLSDALVAFERAEFALETSKTENIGDIATALFRQQLYGNWANALVEAGDDGRALQLLARVEASAGPAVRGTRVEALNVFAKARAEAARGSLEKAIATAERGFDILRGVAADGKYANVDLSRVSFYFDALASGAAGEKRKADAVAKAFRNAQHVGEASVTAERLVATTYIQQRAAQDPEIRGSIDAFEAAQFRRQRAEVEFAIIAAQPRLNDGTRVDAAMLESFRQAVVDSTSLQESARRRIEDAIPEYFTLNNQRVTVAEVQAKLRSDEALVRFIVGDARSYGFVVSRATSIIYPIALYSDDISAAVATLRTSIEAKGAKPFEVAAAADLYAKLFGPAAPEISAKAHLVVVPEGSLLRLPMGILVTAAPSNLTPGDYSGVDFLARSKTLTISPSAGSFVAQRGAAPSRASEAFVAFADFTPPSAASLADTQEALRCGDRVLSENSFTPLPETYAEAVSVATSLGVRHSAVIRGAGFTKTKFQDQAKSLENYRIVYFATHGFLPNEYACNVQPGLLMSYAPGLSATDLILTAPEIMQLSLDADLVVLSACNTAGGGLTGQGARVGESLSGLVRAFFQAGSRSVIATHWAVPSAQSVTLMAGAFDNFKGEAGDFAAALRNAQTKMIAGGGVTSHPFYWGAYTVNGAGAFDKQSTALQAQNQADRTQ